MVFEYTSNHMFTSILRTNERTVHTHWGLSHIYI